MGKHFFGTALLVAVLVTPSQVAAESMFGALTEAYENNPSLNSARAGVRVQNESIALAKSAFRPRVTGTGGITNSWSTGSTGSTSSTFGINISQSVFTGFQNRNSLRSSQASLRAARENLRNSEQNTLFDAAQVYMDVLANRQIAVLRERNIEFLREQLRAAQARFDVGEGTRTDVEQARARLANAEAGLDFAIAAAESSAAVYRQVVGSEPGSLSPAKPLERDMPSSLGAAQAIAFNEHPAIRVNNHLVDSSLFSVKSAEGAFLPNVSISASASRSFTGSGAVVGPTATPTTTDSASIGASVSVPIYQGGSASASLRQSKEALGQARINTDVARDQVRAAVVSAWSQLRASKKAITAERENLRASRLALEGVIQERDVGQRTTLDVLNAQATVLNAQISLVSAERTLVVSSYALKSAVGRLTASRLGLNVRLHDPKEHYEKVKDMWYGLRTPDGR